MSVKLQYVSSNGNTYDINAESIKTKTADLHTWKWEPVGTQLQYGSRFANFTRKVAAYDIDMVIPGPRLAAKALLNDLHQAFEYDMRNMTPCRIIFGDYYIDGYVTGSDTEPYNYMWARNKITVTCPYPFWIREVKHSFMPQDAPGSQTFLDYEYDYNYDYFYGNPGIAIWPLDFPFAAEFKMDIFGPVATPRVLVNGYPYQINETLEENEYLTIDSRKNTVYKRLANGQQVNIFDLREKTQSVFEPMPGGNLTVTWSGAFGFDITIYQERSEPQWTV